MHIKEEVRVRNFLRSSMSCKRGCNLIKEIMKSLFICKNQKLILVSMELYLTPIREFPSTEFIYHVVTDALNDLSSNELSTERLFSLQ